MPYTKPIDRGLEEELKHYIESCGENVMKKPYFEYIDRYIDKK